MARGDSLVGKTEEKAMMKALIPEEPQVIGVLGAVLIAGYRLQQRV
jgi:activator of 2-hydroxyglutaryl-CoA dehydratase